MFHLMPRSGCGGASPWRRRCCRWARPWWEPAPGRPPDDPMGREGAPSGAADVWALAGLAAPCPLTAWIRERKGRM